MIERSASDVAVAAQLACLLEASARKPGNVSPGRHFEDVRYEDFLASAAAIGVPLAGAASRPLGTTIRLAVDATAAWTRSNTNLGIVLLLAPLARAALQEIKNGVGSRFFELTNFGSFVREDPEKGVGSDFVVGGDFREAVRQVLETTTVDDAREVYAAIRCAHPGGLGRVPTQDVTNEPTTTLLEAMRLAAGRDGIAREYTTAFERTFETGAPALATARRDGLSWDAAVIETFLTLLAEAPDTHIARRGGLAAAVEASRLARAALDAGGIRSDAGRRAIDQADAVLRDPDHIGNPGTTADLTAAAIFVVLLGGGWTCRP